MRVRVLFFGMLKDLAGVSEDRLEIAEGATVGSVFDHYADRFPRIGTMAGSIVMARNHEFSPLSAAVEDGDEVAFLPPVSGGTDDYCQEISVDGNFFALTRCPIDVRQIATGLLRGEDGAVVTFEGVVRNHTEGRRTRWLEYEGYESMAVQTMARIGREIAAAYRD